MSAAPRVVLVVAVAENGIIGAAGGLPWRVKADLRRFRNVTMGNPMIMGRKTFESIGRMLDGRDSIVLTRRPDFTAAGVLVAGDLPTALRIATDCAAARSAAEICVIGGGWVFAEILPLADRLDVTHIAATPEGDATFPEISPSDWIEVRREPLPAHVGDTAAAVSTVYERRR